jgi:hypothetical protein
MLDLGNSTKWVYSFSQEFNAKFFRENDYYPMYEQPINAKLFESIILAVLVEAQKNHPPNWNYGGKINQYIKANILDFKSITTASIKSFPLKLNKINLIVPDKSLAKEYAISYTPAKWFFYAKLTVWEYIDNSIVDSNNRLENIENLLLNVGSTVETINTNIIKSKDLYGLP